LPKPRDITNMRFNNLVAIEKAQSRGGHAYWRFRCDCGNKKEIMTCHVIDGTVKSCGCVQTAVRNTNNELPNDQTTRVCRICGSQFFGFLGDTRVFCYNCSPRGASVADAHRLQISLALKEKMAQSDILILNRRASPHTLVCGDTALSILSNGPAQ
jgi:hypothetical protein